MNRNYCFLINTRSSWLALLTLYLALLSSLLHKLMDLQKNLLPQKTGFAFLDLLACPTRRLAPHTSLSLFGALGGYPLVY